MPSVKYSAKALADLQRLHDFLATQDKDVAKRAIIDFGSSGYTARFRHLPNGDITIARIKHQKEDDFILPKAAL